MTWPRSIVGRVGQLLAGLVVSATGIWMTIRAELGVAPWEVLHIGLADRLDVGVGTASIAVGVVLVVLVTAAGVRPGLRTALSRSTLCATPPREDHRTAGAPRSLPRRL